MDLPTFNDLFAVSRNELLARNQKLSLAEVDRTGSDLNIVVGAIAAGADEVTGQLARVAKSRLLATARGSELEVLVYDRYGLLRKPSSPSYTYVHFTTTAAAGASFTIPDGTLLSAADGLQFVSVGSETFPVGSTGPVRVTVRSLEAGSGQRAVAGAITSVITQIVGAPADLEVTNPAATFGGEDSETDEELIARARSFFVNARRGTAEAIRAAVLSFPGVRTCNVFEHYDLLGRPVGPVAVVIADGYTDLFAQSGSPGSYQLQSDAMVNQLQQFLAEYRAAGIMLSITVAQVQLMSVQMSLSYLAGYDTDAVDTAARAAVIQHINTRRPGESVTMAGMYGALQLVPGLAYTGQEILSPRGTTAVGGGQVLRTNLAMVKVL